MSNHGVEIDDDPGQMAVPSTNTGGEDTIYDSVDMAALSRLEEVQMEGEPDLIVELIDLYLTDAPRQISRLLEAVTKTDGTLLKRAAHSLKGSSANLGVLQMAALCDELERVDSGQSFQGVITILTRLEQEFERVRQVFTAERERRLSVEH
jgi:two-component system sensor histidine kinase/response regulator